MRYISTRGDAPPVGFLEAVLAGLAPDGGLYSPEVWPLFSADEIARFHGRPYAEVAADILSAFAGEALPRADLLDITGDAYAGFTHAAVAPLKELSPGLWLLELFHGPTLAFKDIALQLLARLYERALEAGAAPLTIVCATSGDTGGGAVEALAGRAGVRLVVLFPDGKISEVQRRFITTSAADNVQCLAIDGSFDDCQAIVKALFQAQGFREAVNLTGVNSINWARIAAQVVYYFTGRRRPGRAGQARGLFDPDRQLRRRLCGLRRTAHGPAHRADRGGHQQQRHPGADLRERRLRPRQGRRDPEPRHGHPDRHHLRAALLRGGRP